MSKIYQDSHSLYVKVNGSYYRPILPERNYGYEFLDFNKTSELKIVKNTLSAFTVKDKPKVKFISHTPHCSVENNGTTKFVSKLFMRVGNCFRGRNYSRRIRKDYFNLIWKTFAI
jgi:hypothetical protein